VTPHGGQARRAFPPERSGVASGESPPIEKVRTFSDRRFFRDTAWGSSATEVASGSHADARCVRATAVGHPGPGGRSRSGAGATGRLGRRRWTDRGRTVGRRLGVPFVAGTDRPRPTRMPRPNGRDATVGTAEAGPGAARRRSEPRRRPKPPRWLRSPCQGAWGSARTSSRRGEPSSLPRGGGRTEGPRRRDPRRIARGRTGGAWSKVDPRSPPRWGPVGHRRPCAGGEGVGQGVCEGTIPRGR
jgi:hypothetical protein